jgi:hypothetical protein
MNVRICPKCLATDVDRSTARGFYERFVLRVRGKRPFRCAECRFRYYDAAGAQRILICDVPGQVTAAQGESHSVAV